MPEWLIARSTGGRKRTRVAKFRGLKKPNRYTETDRVFTELVAIRMSIWFHETVKPSPDVFPFAIKRKAMQENDAEFKFAI